MNQSQFTDPPANPQESACTGITIDHVDDQQPFLELTSDYLTNELTDITIINRTDPEDAVSFLETNNVDIDCIVTDYAMGPLNGLEFYEQAKSLAPDIPFILLTNEDPDAVVADAFEIGIDSYIQKSSGTANFSILANRISILVELYRQRQ